MEYSLRSCTFGFGFNMKSVMSSKYFLFCRECKKISKMLDLSDFCIERLPHTHHI